MSADYPNKKMAQKNINYPVGHKGIVIDASIEGRPNESPKTIRSGSVKGKKGAGHIGGTNQSHA